MPKTLTLSPSHVRRLAVTRQMLAGPRPAPDAQGMLRTVRDLGCLQLDPISAVARSHLLVLWSRLGPYDPAQLDALLYEERHLFEYWAHAASIVLTEDYPIHHRLMRNYPSGSSSWSRRLASWAEDNKALRANIHDRLEREGPLLSRQLEDQSTRDWKSGGWTSGRNVSRMLDFMWTRGEIMVAGRVGQQRKWNLAERCLPDWTPREHLEAHETVRRAAQRSLRALGAARPVDIKAHFTRHRYPGLEGALRDLEAEGTIQRVEVVEDGQPWPGPWYVHSADLPLLEGLDDHWQPRTTLLSPFDNLICDRARTERLFNFRYRVEIYVPKEQREYGYYVLPILHGDSLIGRVDPTMDRKAKRLRINAVYAEPGAPMTRETGEHVRAAVEELAAFLGAREIEFGERAPRGWKGALS